jgi:hypothetical protein
MKILKHKTRKTTANMALKNWRKWITETKEGTCRKHISQKTQLNNLTFVVCIVAPVVMLIF